jgi:ppGpp synthetase/RelA/SpoT-type nucleotidyltranferase
VVSEPSATPDAAADLEDAPSVEADSPIPVSVPSLTEPQIALLVDRYKLEMARYEKAAFSVGERLRRELRQAGVKHMVSSRPKHPTDLAEKLRKKAADPKKADVYRWDSLKDDVGAVVTDLAGCRVVVYSAGDEEVVGSMIERLFAQPPHADAKVVRHRSWDKPYWATHALVHPYGPGENVDMTIEGAICEIQVVTVAGHLFNEIEHDITYKDRDAGLTASDEERQLVDELRGVARVADRLVSQLLELRAKRRDELAHKIETAEDLRYALSQHGNRNFDGTEVWRLHRLLEQCLEPLTSAALRELGAVDSVVASGRNRLGQDTEEYGEAILYTVGLLDRFPEEIERSVGRWRGPRTSMRKALELAIRNAAEQTEKKS